MSQTQTRSPVSFPNPKPIVRLTETAIMLALAVVLSIATPFKLPYGGSITLASLAPILVIAYRYGVRWGLFSAFAFSLLQLLFGLDNLSYATTFIAMLAIIFLDYLLAFSALCAGGFFRHRFASQSTALGLGALCACVIRFIFHVIVGCTAWAGISIPTQAALLYSLSYNATYMIPETIVTVLAVIYLGRVLNLRSERLESLSNRPGTTRKVFGLRVLAGLILTAVGIFDVARIFKPLQDAESGEFSLNGLSTVPWTLLGIITAIGAVVALVLWLMAHTAYKSAAAYKSDE